MLNHHELFLSSWYSNSSNGNRFIMSLSCLAIFMKLYTQVVFPGALQWLIKIFGELCRKHTGKPFPPTHCSGSVPIDGIFATSGIDCVILPHYGGIEDHCCFIIDISLDSMIGTSFPNIVRCATRKLHCSSTRMIKVYNMELTRLWNEHNLFHRMNVIYCLTDYLKNNDFGLLMDAWDNKFMQLMLHSETECSKFMMGEIEWSPTISVWLSRQWFLHWVCL